MGAYLDIPVHHIKAMLVRSHFDAMEICVADAPGADELLLALAVTNGGRPFARVGGLAAATPSARTGCTEPRAGRGDDVRTLIAGIGEVVSGDIDAPLPRRRLDLDRRRTDRGDRPRT